MKFGSWSPSTIPGEDGIVEGQDHTWLSTNAKLACLQSSGCHEITPSASVSSLWLACTSSSSQRNSRSCPRHRRSTGFLRWFAERLGPFFPSK